VGKTVYPVDNVKDLNLNLIAGRLSEDSRIIMDDGSGTKLLAKFLVPLSNIM
jgi:hypothetical protein